MPTNQEVVREFITGVNNKEMHEVFQDDVCRCIECAVKKDQTVDAPPYDYIPTEEEKEEIKQTIASYQGAFV